MKNNVNVYIGVAAHAHQLKKYIPPKKEKKSGILKITNYRERKSSFRGYFKTLDWWIRDGTQYCKECSNKLL
ncbi:hypothetical protein [Bacillus mycoides]|uniref:hypothetical protein n=1 Tax=Bacillus mycoides TaxID=1405 RepID=UPI0025A2A844|nr:hypothetical protein [Bacillus mycoides]MDM5428504.1 hypothetical protein [Bacillus mycoides]